MEYLAPPLEANATSLYQKFVEAMEVFFPGWTPAPGNLDARIGSAQSLMDAQLMEAASDGATNIFRYFGANIVGIPPHEATLASGTTNWVLTDTLGHVIPQGTVVVWTDALGNRQGFETLEAFTVIAGNKEANGIPVRALEAGEEGNGLTGIATELATPLSVVASVTLTAPTNGGSAAEGDPEYLARLREEYRLLTPKPILAKDFTQILLGKISVGRATTIGGFAQIEITQASGIVTGSKTISALPEAVVNQLAPGSRVIGTGIAAFTYVTAILSTTSVEVSIAATKTETSSLRYSSLVNQAGRVTSWATNLVGEALTEEARLALEAEVQAECLSGVIYNLLNPSYTTVNVVANVVAWTGQNTASIKEAVESAIKSYLSPLTWGQPPLGQSKEWNNDQTVRLVNVEHIVLQTLGTHFVSSLTLNGSSADVDLRTGNALPMVVLPKLGTLTVNVSIG